MLPTPLTALLALLAGLAQALSLAWPGSGQPLGTLQLASLAVLVALLERQLARARADTAAWADRGTPDARMAAVTGGLFGLAWLAGTFWWLFISMHTYGGLAAPLAAGAVLTLAGALAVFYAAAAGLYFKVFSAIPSAGWSFRALVFASFWTLAELARGQVFTGFPWGAGGYAHVDSLLAGYAPWLGVYGLGALAAGAAATVPHLRRGGAGPWLGLLLVLALPPVAAVSGLVPASTSAGRLTVELLQGNIAQDEKFQARTGIADALHWYSTRLHAARADLVVAPETALPLLPRQLPDGLWARLRARFEAGEKPQAALIGVPLGDFEQGYTNSVVGLLPGQPFTEAGGWRYHKHHLVPFGEFIPPGFRWFVRMMNIPLGDFNRGTVAQPSLVFGGQRLAANICYEDLFGEELGARFADPATAPTAFVNLSNIAWFGDSLAIDQHLAISRMRALEFARPMLRATNTGATAIIDHRGTVVAQLPRRTRGVLPGEFEGRSGLTPYARWVSAWGLAPLWGLGLAVLLLSLWRVRAGRAARR
jgi:apolipoprotein N-acyltransferase